jgi:hypothetical protein
MVRPGDVMRMASLGMIGALIGLGGKGFGAMLDGFNSRGGCQRQGKAQGRQKRPEPSLSSFRCLHHGPSGLTSVRVLPYPPQGDTVGKCRKITSTQATLPSSPG